jgi:protein XRP2
MIPKEETKSNTGSPAAHSSPEAGRAGKLDKRHYMFINLTEQELIKRPGEVNGNTFKLSYLLDCTVWLLDHSANVYADECENSRLHLGPVAGAAQLQDLDAAW